MRLAPAIRPIRPLNGRQIYLGHGIQEKPGQIALRQPVLQRRRQQIELVTITRQKVVAHGSPPLGYGGTNIHNIT